VRSTIPRGLDSLHHFDRGIDWSEFTVVTAADIPGKNHIQLIFADQPCLADGAVNHCDEAIVLLAHADKYKLRAAVDAVRIEYEPLPAVFTIEESERQDVIVWGADNCSRASCSKRAMWTLCGQARRTLSKASTAPARRSISTLRTTV
jgi:xanthine dehydrogenase molybdopterin-binding subunit B